jgi:hypothetical protein
MLTATECTEEGCIFLVDDYRYTDEELSDPEAWVVCEWHIAQANLEEQADIYRAWVGGE